jgi:hypothetical protein
MENQINIDRLRVVKNGGIEQALLEIANEDGLLNSRDRERLSYLQMQPQNRIETTDEILLATITPPIA